MRRMLFGAFIVLLIFVVSTTGARAACDSLDVSPSNPTVEDTIVFLARNCTEQQFSYQLMIVETGEGGGTRFLSLPTASGNSYGTLISPGQLPVGTFNIHLQENGNTIHSSVLTVSTGGLPAPPQQPAPGEGASGGTAQEVECKDRPGTVNTAIGCVDFNDVNALTRFFLGWAMGIAGGVALLLIGFAAFRISTSQGDPRRLEGGKELLLSAIGGLLMVVLSVFLLRFIGVDLLGLF